MELQDAKRPRVFISYARPDQSAAEQLAAVLSTSGFDPWLDIAKVSADESLEKALRAALSDSDFFIVLISARAGQRQWASWELAEASRPQHRARQMPIVPVLLEDASLPPAIRSLRSVPLKAEDGRVGTPVVEALSQLHSINFSRLNPAQFERLISDLLPQLGFAFVRPARGSPGHLFDFEAGLTLPDPFGATREEVWMIEVKHHHVSRVGTAVIAEFAGRVMFLPSDSRGAIVTSGTLTSAARDFLNGPVRDRALRLQVIEGDVLRQLVAPYPAIVDKYFPADGPS